MRIIHTSDWHIGQSFFTHDRTAEYERLFDWLREVVRHHSPDAILVSGDIFDTANPSAASQKMLYNLLSTLVMENPKLEIVLTSGNHDSGARLQAPRDILDSMGVYVRGVVERIDGEIDYDSLIIPLHRREDGILAAYCLAVPFLRQGDLPLIEREQGINAIDRECAGVREIYSLLIARAKEMMGANSVPIIAMGHLQATGSEFSIDDNSERHLVGGLESVPPEIFDNSAGVTYTALGHIHKPQRVSFRESVRYSGSPLPLSFAEKHYKHGVNLVELDNVGNSVITRIPFTDRVELLTIPSKADSIENVIPLLEALPLGEADDSSPFLEVAVLITQPDTTIRTQVESALKDKAVRLCRITTSYPPKESQQEERPLTIEEYRKISPLEVAKRYYRAKFSSDMPLEIEELFLEAEQRVNHSEE